MKNIFHLLLSLALVSVASAQTVYPPVQRSTLLVSGRIPIVGANGIVSDSPGLTFASSTLTAGTFAGALSGNATTATTLATPRAINGVNFDGSAAITVPAASITLTGTTLASNVVTSSLTGVGTVTAGVWQATPVGDSFIASALTGKSYNGVTTSGSGTLANSGTSALTGFTGSGTSSGTNTGDQTISDATISFTDITTGNASTTKHGFVPKLPNDATKYYDGTGAYSVPAGTTAGANPSASVGLTAVNGSASTFMRSDAAPALSVAIVPTWTGTHNWSVSAPVAATTAITAVSTSTSTTAGGNTTRVGFFQASTGSTTVDFTGGGTTSPNQGVYAFRFLSSHTGSGTVTFQRGITVGPTVTGGNSTSVLSYMAEAPSVASGKTATNWNQFYAVGSSGVSGALGTYVGFYSEACTAGSTANWGFYDPSNANYFGGRLQIGSTTNHSSEQLQVTGTGYVSSDLTVGGTINGTLNGGATSAGTVAVNTDSTNASYYPTLVSNTGGNFAVKVAGTLRFNPSTGVMTANSFAGDLTGNAATATAATNLAVTNDDTTNATFYPVFVSAASGNHPATVSSADFSWNPLAGQLTLGGPLQANGGVNIDAAQALNIGSVQIAASSGAHTSIFGNPDTSSINIFGSDTDHAGEMIQVNGDGYVTGTLAAAHVSGTGTAPTIAAGTGSGTSPTVSVSGHDAAFKISVTTGTLPTLSGVICTVTFNTAFASAPHFSLTPSDGTAAALSAATSVIPSSTTTTFVLTAGPTALAGATTYTWEVICVQ